MRGGATHGKTTIKSWEREDREKKSGERREKTRKKKGMHQ